MSLPSQNVCPIGGVVLSRVSEDFINTKPKYLSFFHWLSNNYLKMTTHQIYSAIVSFSIKIIGSQRTYSETEKKILLCFLNSLDIKFSNSDDKSIIDFSFDTLESKYTGPANDIVLLKLELRFIALYFFIYRFIKSGEQMFLEQPEYISYFFDIIQDNIRTKGKPVIVGREIDKRRSFCETDVYGKYEKSFLVTAADFGCLLTHYGISISLNTFISMVSFCTYGVNNIFQADSVLLIRIISLYGYIFQNTVVKNNIKRRIEYLQNEEECKKKKAFNKKYHVSRKLT